MGAQNGGNGNGQDDDKVRRRRNIALALILGGLVVLFYLMTMVRIGDQ